METIALNPLVWLSQNGAMFVPVRAQDKAPIGEEWQRHPFTIHQIQSHVQKGGNVGLLVGKYSNGLCALDIDRDFTKFLAKFPRFANSPRIVRGNALDRGKVLIKIAGDIPPPRKWKPVPHDSPYAEWLSTGNQAVVPPSIHPTGQPFELVNADQPVPQLTAKELSDIWYRWTNTDLVENTTTTARPAKKQSSPTSDAWQAVKDEIRGKFDMVAYACREFGTTAQKEGKQYRILGQGGLLINPDENVWCTFGEGNGDGKVGGDCFDLVSFVKFKRVRVTGAEWADTVKEAAAYTSVPLPERTTTAPPATQQQTAAVAPLAPPESTIDPDANEYGTSFRALPAEAIEVYEHLSPDTARWLFEYVKFAKIASPMTPAPFHQAAALFAVSTIIARRLCIKVSTEEIFPNLFILFLARSTIYSKTTGFKLIETLFHESGLQHHLLPQRMTPEAMLVELSLNMPNSLNLSDVESRMAWLRERAFAAQRGWMLDEAHSLLDGLKRDFNMGLMAMLLKLYDCPKATIEQTVGRGRVTVKNGYLSFFGATTPVSAADHLTNNLLWQNGMWARFALVTYDEESDFKFFPDALELPRALINQFRGFSELFPTPRAELVEVEDIDGSKRKVVELLDVSDPATARLESGVWEAWETYTRFVRHELLITKAVDDELFGSYGRLGTLVMKVAMILAVMDTRQLPVVVTLAHYALAQVLVEEWRESLHQLRDRVLTTTEHSQRDRVLELLTRAGENGLLLRDIYRPLNLPAKKVKEHLEELRDTGQVELYEAFATNGRKVQMAKRIGATSPHKDVA